jgi:hypothetical protein
MTWPRLLLGDLHRCHRVTLTIAPAVERKMLYHLPWRVHEGENLNERLFNICKNLIFPNEKQQLLETGAKSEKL